MSPKIAGAAANRSFRAFTIKHQNLTNRIMTDVNVTVAFDPANPPVPPPTPQATSALWDTGANGSCITPSLAASLQLQSVGPITIAHAGGSQTKNTYLVNVYLPNRVAIAGLRVSEFVGPGQFGMLIGMDVIMMGDFSITNCDNQTWVSFRIPSIRGVDYVQEANKIVFSGVGRNSPCPCGKIGPDGRPVKFKRCHGA